MEHVLKGESYSRAAKVEIDVVPEMGIGFIEAIDAPVNYTSIKTDPTDPDGKSKVATVIVQFSVEDWDAMIDKYIEERGNHA
jgi:hypothetical protein